ncbi:penicillin acylase family protein [Pulveribacter suum]|uniref:Acylase n=1 Tax=Pulveribacter suum TaxID=2116657 RepID=A0A2P1NN15_9BURK|nr:penicillin acylase family protein [Pulveribacter suum]AVP58403.1 acylase [Pulveribacter suum]
MQHTMLRGARPRVALTLAALAALAACGGGGGGSSDGGAKYSAEIRRTTMGVPHVKAQDWGGLGYGVGYAQAQDNLCTLADSFLTYRGERSRHFGGDAIAVYDSTIDRPRNIDSDFFFRHVVSPDVVAAMSGAQDAKMHALVSGFVAGYNRYVGEAQKAGTAHAACRGEGWVQPIAEDDLWRRMYAANLAGGYSNFVAAIANATPPGASAAAKQQLAALAPEDIAPPRLQVAGTRGIGSNMYGFGSAVTGGDGPVMFGNPHWFWKGADRFYQAQLTIPGELNVSGASFLGVPMVLIGFNENVAWSHTVSTARRFGFFQLTLAQGDATSYLVDGKAVKMKAVPISVPVRQADGSTSAVTRTLYKSEYGPMVNLGSMNPALGWNPQSAFAIRDINADNYRTFRNWMRWNQAKSLDEFIAIQKQESAIPWVNTVAVGRGSAQAWYADIGAVPNVSPAQVAQCTTPVGQAMAPLLPGVPIFNGANSACQWQSDADSVQPGAIGPSRMPSLLRSDYVGNMNDSYWLANATAPLTGYPGIFGPAGTSAQTLRTRLGHTMALERLAGTDGYPGNQATSAIVRQMVLNSRVFSAERFKDEILALVCDASNAAACGALRQWDNHGNKDSRGSHLWDEFWTRATAKLPDAQLYTVAFNPAQPLDTPRGINPGAADALKKALADAVQAVQASGFAPDAPRGEVLFATRGGGKIPLFGGCGGVGYFTITCSENPITAGGYSMDGQPHGNSYMQVVNFPASGVQAYTFLTFSLSDDPASPHYGDYTRAYGAKEWVRMPFTEGEITGNADYRTQTVSQ